MKHKSWLVGLVAYLALVLAGPVLKLAQVGPLAYWSWWWATVLVWGPWALLLVFVFGLILRLLCTKRAALAVRDEYYDTVN